MDEIEKLGVKCMTGTKKWPSVVFVKLTRERKKAQLSLVRCLCKVHRIQKLAPSFMHVVGLEDRIYLLVHIKGQFLLIGCSSDSQITPYDEDDDETIPILIRQH